MQEHAERLFVFQKKANALLFEQLAALSDAD